MCLLYNLFQDDERISSKNIKENEQSNHVYRAHLLVSFFSFGLLFISIRAPAKGAIGRCFSRPCAQNVSIRAPTRGAMATHSKIRLFRAPSPPHRPQNRHNLGNPFPRTHPCNRSLRKKTSRFYDHLRFALEPFLAHLTIICVTVAKFRSSLPKRPSFGLITSPNQAMHSTLLDNQRPHRLFL